MDLLNGDIKMRWIGKDQPIYVDRGDYWFNESNGQTYKATSKGWFIEDGSTIPLEADFALHIPYSKRVKYQDKK